MKQLNAAIIGQGRSGRDIHGKHLLTDTERFRVAYVVDGIPERRKKAEHEFPGCLAFADYRELFAKKDDIDFVVNASFSNMHPAVTVDLLKHGLNVFCDKPLAQKASQVEEMINAAKDAGKMLAVFQQSRFLPAFEQIKKVLSSGILGRIVQICFRNNAYARRWDWQTMQEFGGGSLYNTGPHPLDQALDLLDYDGMPGVFCVMDRANSSGDAEDFCKLILTAPGRPLIDLEISSCDAYPSYKFNIQGTSGGLSGTSSELKWRWFIPSESPKRELVKTPLHDEEWNPLYCVEKLAWHEDSWKAEDLPEIAGQAVRKIYSNVYEHLVYGKPLEVTPEQVRRQIEVQEEAHRQNSFWKL